MTIAVLRASPLAALALVGCFQDTPPSFESSSTSSASSSTSTTDPVTTTDVATTSTTSTTTDPTTSTDPSDPTATTDPASTTSPPDMGGSNGFSCPPENTLIACYLFDEPADVLLDSSAFGWNGLMTEVMFSPGRHGSAAQTTTSSLIHGDSQAGPKGGGELTMMAWIRVLALSDDRSGVLNRNGDYGLFVTPQGIPECTGGGLSLQSPVPIELDVWTHLACTRSQGTTSIYVDGVLMKMAAQAAPTPPAQASFNIANDGTPTPSTAFVGEIDEVLLWSRALAADELCILAGLSC